MNNLITGLLDKCPVLKEHVELIKKYDPAVYSDLEAILCYSGLHAIYIYKLAHIFYKNKNYLTARIISQLGRSLTGIEIHPGAQIQDAIFIDHGMGIVIGETAVIQSGTRIFHGVTLGGKSLEKVDRHPKIGKNCIIGAHAQLLGNITIGDNVSIGAGSTVLKDLPDNSTFIPGKGIIEK